MSQLFSRVFLQILDSSIAEDFTTRHVFEDLLKLCDHQSGIVDMTRQALSRRLNVPIETIDKTILKLESPDPNSRDGEFDGRRLERLDDHRDWGWRIINWEKYDAIRTKADAAIRVDRHRNKKKDVEEKALQLNTPPDHINTEVFKKKWAEWISCRMGNRKPKDWNIFFNEQLVWISKFSESDAVEVLSASIRNGWTGLFEPKANGFNKVKSPAQRWGKVQL